MGMTITEKILAAHAGKDYVEPGELISAKLDGVLSNDITAPISIKEMAKIGIDGVFDREKIFLVLDHFVPNKDIASAEQCRMVREFAKKHRIKHFYDVGQMGIEHALLPEQGLVLPGDAVIGADSHTCTYGGIGAFSTGVGSTDAAAAMATGELWLKVPKSIKFVYKGKPDKWVSGKDLILHTIGDIGVDGALYQAMEFTGEVIDALPVDGRLTMCNMAIEAGGKSGIIAPDEKTLEYVRARAKRPFKVYQSDPDAEYADIKEYDLTGMEPQVACPYLPENTRPVSALADTWVDQVVIGACTNGRISDLRTAAKIIAGKKVHPDVRMIVIPATQEIYLQALKEGLIEIFVNAGAAFSTPTCGPCLGGYMGILGAGEKCLATTNRNFIGRMGHKTSELFLASPAVAAATAVKGRIAHPEEVA